MRRRQRRPGICLWLALLLLSVCSRRARGAQPRVIQLVAENTSPFVSTDPNEPKLIVGMYADAAKAASVVPDAPLSQSAVMADAAGRRYNCSIPARSSVAAGSEAVTAHPALVKSPFELLEGLTSCLYRKDGLWTYEVCHRRHVRQFRQVSWLGDGSRSASDSVRLNVNGKQLEPGELGSLGLSSELTKALGDWLGEAGFGHLLSKDSSGKAGEDFSCGQYAGDDEQSEAILEDASASGHPLRYVAHTFRGGASCVLTGAPRTAEVRYTCGRDSAENVVASVREFPTCNYVVVVATPFLCKHPAFAPAPQDIRLVSCVPLEPDEPGGSSSSSSSSSGARPPRLRKARGGAGAAAAAVEPGGPEEEEADLQPAASPAAGAAAVARVGSSSSSSSQPAQPRGGRDEPDGISEEAAAAAAAELEQSTRQLVGSSGPPAGRLGADAVRGGSGGGGGGREASAGDDAAVAREERAAARRRRAASRRDEL